METPSNILVSCSSEHAAAIGAYGQLYVWGRNTFYKSPADPSSFISSETENEEETNTPISKLGFTNDILEIPEPTYISLTHPLYRVNSIQVSCSHNFTAVVAKEKPNILRQEDQNEFLFSLETDDRATDYVASNFKDLDEKLFKNAVLANRIRIEITEYLTKQKIDFMSFFKSPIVKESTFMRLMLHTLTKSFKEEEIRRLIDYKKMRMPGNDLKLKPLYELIMKTHQGEGILYILGSESILPKDSTGIQLALQVKSANISYYIVHLPSQVICSKVCCGKNFILVLSSYGLVYSWGDAYTPALGKNRPSSYNQIRGVNGLMTEKMKVVDIACGLSHCIAMTNTNMVMTWGEGEFGKLGNGRTDPSAWPEAISLDSRDPLFIKAFGHNSFCQMRDGSCFFWGSNENCKLGPEYSKLFYDKGIELEIAEKDGVTDIAIGNTAVVYIDKSGLLHQISAQGEVFLSKRNKNMEGVEFYQVVCFGDTFFAISKKGSIFSWTLEEECANLGRTNNPSVPFEIESCAQHFPIIEEKDPEEETPGETNNVKSKKIVSCHCTEENTFLITDKGEVLATGGNEYGQMGIARGDLEMFEDDLPDRFEEFIFVPRLSKAFKVSINKLAAGVNHILAISTGKLLSWGCNSSGQLGLGNFSHSQKFPEVVRALESVSIVEAAAGLTHSLALTSTGEVFSFGSAESGKLGQGRLNDSISIAEPKLISSLFEVSHIACSIGHSVAINKHKRLFCWGDNWRGQLGTGSKNSEYLPRELLGFIEWRNVACGPNHTVALSKEGKAYHWGQINMPDHESEYLQPILVKGLEDITIGKVFAADGYSAALTSTGASVYLWGKELHKRLVGAKAEVTEGKLMGINGFAISSEKIMGFAVGSLHGCIVTDQNSVMTWGYTANGRCGDPGLKGGDKVFNGSFFNMTKYFGVAEKGSNDCEEVITNLQLMLQNEPEELSESNIREVDKKITLKFNECIDKFIKLTEAEEQNEKFMDQIEYKMLSRLQQKPIDCKLVQNHGEVSEEIKPKLVYYGAMISTYQVHPCYVYKLLFKAKLKAEHKLDMINLVYADIENNPKLIYICVYLSQMILEKLLKSETVTFATLFDTPDGNLYRELVVKMILSSQKDMNVMRALAAEIFQNLSNSVNQDENGIDIDPMTAGKPASNKMSAYQNNKNVIDRRMNKLKQIIFFFSQSLIKLKPNSDQETAIQETFSPMVGLVVRDFVAKCAKRFGFKISKFDPQLEHIQKIAHVVLDMVFDPLCRALSKPHEYYVVIENKHAASNKNLSALSEAVKGFLSGNKIYESDRWLNDLNAFNTENPLNIERKVQVIEYLYGFEYDLEELYLVSLFKHSLSQYDSIITVPGRTLIKLHSLTFQNLEVLRVNNPSYDPLIFLCKELESVPPLKVFSPLECVNLPLFTRSLRQDQSIVRCIQCEMLIPREMAPSNFKSVIEIYDPMPPNSPVFLYTKCLANSCKKQHKGRIDEFLKIYQERCQKYVKDYKAVENVKYLLHLVDTSIAAANEIPIDTEDISQINFIEKEREVELRAIEKQCEKEYLRRRYHRKVQENLTRIFNILLDMLDNFEKNNFFSTTRKEELMFNVEYGGSNRDLEAFSDSVMFGIFLNKIRDYTMKKEMSISLYENLKGEMNNSLRGFMKRSLSELKRKKFFIADPIIPPTIQEKSVIFSFEIDQGSLIIIVTSSPSKLNICGRDEFRHEELLVYAKINSEQISKVRDEVKSETDTEP